MTLHYKVQRKSSMKKDIVKKSCPDCSVCLSVRDGGWSSWKCPIGSGRLPFRVCDNPKPDKGNPCTGPEKLICGKHPERHDGLPNFYKEKGTFCGIAWKYLTNLRFRFLYRGLQVCVKYLCARNYSFFFFIFR